jgi:hypothetical protein
MITWLCDVKEDLEGVHVLGVHKGGTTRIFEVLISHPEIYGTRPKQHLYFYNEEHKFDVDDFKSITGIPSVPEIKFADATPDHFFDLRAAKNIARLENNRLMLVSLRNPIDRAYSHWVMNNGPKKKKQFISSPPRSCIERGLYLDALKTYRGLDVGGFGVVFFESWTKQENLLFDEIADLLSIDKNLFSLNRASKNAPYKSPLIRDLIIRVPTQLKSILPLMARSFLREKLTGYGDTGILTDDDRMKLLPLFISDIEACSDLLRQDLLGIWKLE